MKIFIFLTFSKMSKKSEILPILLNEFTVKYQSFFLIKNFTKKLEKNFRLHDKK